MKIQNMTACLLAACLLTSCGGVRYSKGTKDVTGKYRDTAENGIPKSEDFICAQYQFTVSMIQAAKRLHPQENLFCSPYLAAQTLMLTADESDEKTKQAVSDLFGGMETEKLESHLANWRGSQTASLLAANSLWLKNDSVRLNKPDFLQHVAAYYGADIFSAAFDTETANDMTQWLGSKTAGQITEMPEQPDLHADGAYLSAAAFDLQWEKGYGDNDQSETLFRDAEGKASSMRFLYRRIESLTHIENEQATGVMQMCADGKYAFVCVKPTDMTLEEYISQLTPEQLRGLLQSGTEAKVNTCMPAFTADTENDLGSLLREMNPDAAPAAAACQRSAIQVDRNTEARSYTLFLTYNSDVSWDYTENFDVPFLYFVYDLKYGLPVMTGTFEHP